MSTNFSKPTSRNSSIDYPILLLLLLLQGLTANRDSSAEVLSVGWKHTCAVKSDDTLECWGNNDHGQATPPDGHFSQVGAGEMYTCALKKESIIVCWGRELFDKLFEKDYITKPSKGRFSQISTGTRHACAVTIDGSLECWGNNYSGQAMPPSGYFSQVSAGGDHSCAIKNDGTLECWGDNSYGQATPPSGHFSQVTVGYENICAIKSDGTLVCRGSDQYIARTPSGRFTQVSVTHHYACAIKSDGILVCWNHGGLIQNTPSGRFSQVSTYEWNQNCAVKADFTVFCWSNEASNGSYSDTIVISPPTISLNEQIPSPPITLLNPCTYEITPTNRSHNSAAESGSISVNTSPRCHWIAYSNKSWVTIDSISGNSGQEKGTVVYSIKANTSNQSRRATLYVAGQTFTINQVTTTTDNQPPTANFTISPTEGDVPLRVDLDASDSLDTDGSIVQYDWDANGKTLSGQTISTTLTVAGDNPITLTVTDNQGLVAIAEQTLTLTKNVITNGPIAEVVLTGLKNFYETGEVVKVNLEAVPKAERLRQVKIDLWVVIVLPSRDLLFMSAASPTVQFSPTAQPFKASVENLETTYDILQFEVPANLEGTYTFYTVYVEEGKNPITDGFLVLRSNVAVAETVLNNR